MKKIVCLLFVFILLFSCSATDVSEAIAEDVQVEEKIIVEVEKQYIVRIKQEFESLKNNKLGDDGHKTLNVMLPPTYYDSDKSYPVIYYFHGFSASVPADMSMHWGKINKKMLDGEINEMIIVEVEADGPWSGTFLANSPIIGNYEDYFMKEVIPLIDDTYRTIDSREGRGIAGFSMGGYIALEISFKYPELFSSTYALSPALLIDDELSTALEQWDERFITAYGAAFAYSEDGMQYFIPKMDGSEEDEVVVDRWLDGIGHMEEKIENYMLKYKKLDAIKLEVGSNDYFEWITSGTKHFSELLTEKNIEHELELTNRGHEVNQSIVLGNIIPFFSDNLINE